MGLIHNPPVQRTLIEILEDGTEAVRQSHGGVQELEILPPTELRSGNLDAWSDEFDLLPYRSVNIFAYNSHNKGIRISGGIKMPGTPGFAAVGFFNGATWEVRMGPVLLPSTQGAPKVVWLNTLDPWLDTPIGAAVITVAVADEDDAPTSGEVFITGWALRY